MSKAWKKNKHLDAFIFSNKRMANLFFDSIPFCDPMLRFANLGTDCEVDFLKLESNGMTPYFQHVTYPFISIHFISKLAIPRSLGFLICGNTLCKFIETRNLQCPLQEFFELRSVVSMDPS